MIAHPSSSLRLGQLCEPILTFGIGLRAAVDPGSADSLRAKAHDLFGRLDEAAAAAGVPPADLARVRYALVAYLDEIVLSSHWDIRAVWGSKPLQMELFNDFTAGETFYTRLNEARAMGEAGRQQVEVFCLCIGLGFRGKYGDVSGLDKLKALHAELVHELGASAGPLSRQWRPEDRFVQDVKNLPTWVIAASAAGVLLLVYLMFQLMLGSDVASLHELRAQTVVQPGGK